MAGLHMRKWDSSRITKDSKVVKPEWGVGVTLHSNRPLQECIIVEDMSLRRSRSRWKKILLALLLLVWKGTIEALLAFVLRNSEPTEQWVEVCYCTWNINDKCVNNGIWGWR
ncbi:hypothetical protein AAHE18_04G177400 [Arachis hypogaea]